MEWICFILGIAFILMGLLVFVIQLTGVYKFKYILNRMHAAGMGDTMGISLCLIGAMFIFGWSFTSLKITLIVAFLWLASPVSSHLISRLEVTTNEDLEKYCRVEKEEEEA
jgi:multicomponent Na+:H+ antiporter subunit G